MKKFIMNLFKIEATASQIQGRKATGVDDVQHAKAWKAKNGDCN